VSDHSEGAIRSGPVARLLDGVAADPVKVPASRRASPIPPEERRTSIAVAALKLLLEHGTTVTTRQIAEAANIAEGTIFRVFADKDAVIRAAVDLALDPAPTERALAEIGRSLAFEQQLALAVEIIRRWMGDVGRLVSAVGGPAVLAVRERPLPELAGLVDLFEAERLRLCCEPQRAARLLPALTLAFSHPALFGDEPMRAPELVALLLDGIRERPESANHRGERSGC
jgi:AcrR family transcriptional regulator